MCGRITLYTPPDHLARIFGADLEAGVDPDGRPSWNVPPTRTILALTGERVPPESGEVQHDSPAGEHRGEGDSAAVHLHRHLGRFRWGLVPSWADDLSIGSRMFNARGETVATKPSFRSAFVHRRAAVVADGFYEWHTDADETKQAYYFTRADGSPLALAGLWERWEPKASPGSPTGAMPGLEEAAVAGPIRSCTVVTTEAGPDMGDLHHRTPVVLEVDNLDEWLDPDNVDKVELASLLVAPPAGTIVHRRVGRSVGNVRNDGAALIEAVPDD